MSGRRTRPHIRPPTEDAVPMADEHAAHEEPEQVCPMCGLTVRVHYSCGCGGGRIRMPVCRRCAQLQAKRVAERIALLGDGRDGKPYGKRVPE